MAPISVMYMARADLINKGRRHAHAEHAPVKLPGKFRSRFQRIASSESRFSFLQWLLFLAAGRSSLCSSMATMIEEATSTIRPQASSSMGSMRRTNCVQGQ